MTKTPTKTAAKGARSVFGMGPVKELIRLRPEVIERICLAKPTAIADEARAHGVRVDIVSRDELGRLAGQGANHQGIVAITGPYRYADLDEIIEAASVQDEPALVVVLDQVTDPHNLGAVARSAYLLGAHGVIIPQDRAVGVTAVVTKASAGATELLPIARVTNLSRALGELKQAGLWLASAGAGPAATPVWELDASTPLGIVLGAEGSGIRPRVAKQCDFAVEIPMIGKAVGSFNVSVAAGILLYEVARQRGAVG